MLRRDLLKLGSSAALGMLVPGLATLSAADAGADDTSGTMDWNKTLVLIELSGGNDGLNTIVPHADPEYYKLRKSIGIPEKDVIKLDQGLGLNPALKALEPAWKDGDAAVMLGLGYPNNNYSHFRGIDIWNAGSNSVERLADGWLARVMYGAKGSTPSDLLAHSMTLGYSAAYGGGGALFGHDLNRLTFDNPDDFVRRAKHTPKPGVAPRNPAEGYIEQLKRDISATADRLEGFYHKSPAFGDFPKTNLGNKLRMAAKFIASGALCPVYKTTIGGFDNHARLSVEHPRLLSEVGDAIGALRTALKTVPGAWERTVVMTYSEFGRRAEENGSGGCDHGSAAPHFLIGGKIKGGFYGKQPSLTQMDGGNLIFTTDYRTAYTTVAEGWFGYKKPFLTEKGFKPLPCFKA